MAIEIVSACQDSIYSCLTNVFLVTIILMILIFSVWAIVKFRIEMGKFTFEALPMVSACIQAVLQVYINVIDVDIRIFLMSDILQGFTFVIVTASFMQLFCRIKYESENEPKKLETASRVILATFVIVSLILMLNIVLIWSLDVQCNEFQDWYYIVPWIVLFVSTVLNTVFGHLLRSKLAYFEAQQKLEMTNGYQTSVKTSYYQDRQKQIRIVMITTIAFFSSNIVMDIIRTTYFQKDIGCSPADEHHITFRDKDFGDAQIFMLCFSLLQIIPPLIVSYTFYYLPYFSQQTSKTINKKLRDLRQSYLQMTYDDDLDLMRAESFDIQQGMMEDPFLKKIDELFKSENSGGAEAGGNNGNDGVN